MLTDTIRGIGGIAALGAEYDPASDPSQRQPFGRDNVRGDLYDDGQRDADAHMTATTTHGVPVLFVPQKRQIQRPLALHVLSPRFQPLVTLAQAAHLLLVNVGPSTGRFLLNLGDDRTRLLRHGDTIPARVGGGLCRFRRFRRFWLFGFFPHLAFQTVLVDQIQSVYSRKLGVSTCSSSGLRGGDSRSASVGASPIIQL